MSKHPIVHVEISASDLNFAGKFYSDLFEMEYHPNARDELCLL